MHTLTELFGSINSSLAATRAAQPSAILLRNTTAVPHRGQLTEPWRTCSLSSALAVFPSSILL